MSPRAVPLGRTICQSALEPGSSFPFSSGLSKVPPVSGTMHRRPWSRSPRSGGNLDLELDQELHAVLLLSDGAEWRLDPASGDRGRDADVLHAARLAALAMTASRMTLATMSGCDIIRKWEAPSTSVTVEPARL